MRASGLLVPAVLVLATACAPESDVAEILSERPNADLGIETPEAVPEQAPQEPAFTGLSIDRTPTAPPVEEDRIWVSGETSMAGFMVTAQRLDGHLTTGEATIFVDELSFHFDTFTPTGWAMLSGNAYLNAPIEAGQSFELPSYSFLGCAGPQIGEYDFDGGAIEDGTMVIEAGLDGELQLVIEADFGSAGHMVATVPIQED